MSTSKISEPFKGLLRLYTKERKHGLGHPPQVRRMARSSVLLVRALSVRRSQQSSVRLCVVSVVSFFLDRSRRGGPSVLLQEQLQQLVLLLLVGVGWGR